MREIAREQPFMADEFDVQSHQVMWQKFCKLMGYSLVAIVIILALMALTLL